MELMAERLGRGIPRHRGSRVIENMTLVHFNEAISRAYQWIRGANEEQPAENPDVAAIGAAHAPTQEQGFVLVWLFFFSL